jgi:GDPmannose 4,6-dehydratase
LDKEKFRPAEVPIRLAKAVKIQELGWQTNHTLTDIIKDQLNFFCPATLEKAVL